MIIGDPGEEPEYFKRIVDSVETQDLSGNVLLVGFRRDAADLMGALDILIHSSIRPEPFGRVVLEGMTLAKAIIATDMGGPAEMIRNDESGLLVEPDDPKAMAEGIDHLLRHEAIRRRLGQAALRCAKEKFDMNIIVKQVEEVYESLLGDGGESHKSTPESTVSSRPTNEEREELV
jgi:glycosyltransferase involved in cell wall biosynthesis